MSSVRYLVMLLLIISCNGIAAQEKKQPEIAPKMNSNFSIAIHGGAGNMAKKNLTPEKEAEYKDKLKEAIDKGRSMLADGAE